MFRRRENGPEVLLVHPGGPFWEKKDLGAWTIPKGTKAPQAAGTIHTDIERGFIRAEIVSYDDYVAYKTMDAIRSAGKLRSEGKEYVMQEGDVVEFRFNV